MNPVCANCGAPIGQVFITGIGVWIHFPDDGKLLSPQNCRNGNFTRAWPEGKPRWTPTDTPKSRFDVMPEAH